MSLRLHSIHRNTFSSKAAATLTMRKFARPQLITFDAFGTIYTPKGSVQQQYSNYVHQHHDIYVEPEVIGRQFRQAYKQLEQEQPSYGIDKGSTIDAWWGEVVRRAFKPTQLPSDAVAGLLNHFNTKDAYTIFGDAVTAMRKFHERGLPVGILSNSDPRLRDVLSSMDLIKYLATSKADKATPHICISYETGVEKPSKGAFDAAQRMILGANNNSDTSTFWHVGDDKRKDGEGALNAGWNCIVVNREATEPLTVESHGERAKVTVNSLENVDELFE